MGVTTKKKIIPITNGEITLPKKIPNLNQILFNGVNIFEFKKPKIKKISNNIYRVYLGPYNNIKSLQKSFNDINILEFDNIEIIKND